MTATSQELLKQALSLPPIQRVEFPTRHQLDALWADEVEDRIDSYDQGKIVSIPADEVFARVNRP